jgi:hypothetical protein
MQMIKSSPKNIPRNLFNQVVDFGGEGGYHSIFLWISMQKSAKSQALCLDSYGRLGDGIFLSLRTALQMICEEARPEQHKTRPCPGVKIFQSLQRQIAKDSQK